MKMKMVTALFVLSLGTTASFARTGASDGSDFGHGEDSIRCFWKNISIYTEYVKTNNFKDAYSLDERIYRSPKSPISTYTNGAKFFNCFNSR